MTTTTPVLLASVQAWPTGLQAVLLGLMGVGYKREDMLYLLNMEDGALDALFAELLRNGWLSATADGWYSMLMRAQMLGNVALTQLLVNGDMERMVDAMANRVAPVASEFGRTDELADRVRKIRAHIDLVRANLPEGF